MTALSQPFTSQLILELVLRKPESSWISMGHGESPGSEWLLQ